MYAYLSLIFTLDWSKQDKIELDIQKKIITQNGNSPINLNNNFSKGYEPVSVSLYTVLKDLFTKIISSRKWYLFQSNVSKVSNYSSLSDNSQSPLECQVEIMKWNEDSDMNTESDMLAFRGLCSIKLNKWQDRQLWYD